MNNFTISFGENIQQPEYIYPYSLEYLFSYMGYSEKNEWLVEDIRKAHNEGNKDLKSDLKKSLPYVIPSLLSENRRHSDCFLKSNGFIFDADHLSDPEKIKEQIKNIEFVHFAFVSPSGDGLKIGVKTSVFMDNPEWYSKAYRYCSCKLSEILRVKLDKTSDCVRACFLSYDDNLYYNPESIPWFPKFAIDKPVEYVQNVVNIDDEFKKCMEACRSLKISDYMDWITCMFSFKNSFGEPGYELFRALSFGKGYKDNEQDLQYKWRTVPNDLSVGIGSFWFLANKYGFRR